MRAHFAATLEFPPGGWGLGMGPAPPRLRVIVTRARDQLEPLAERIEVLGYEVVRCPLIELEPTGPPEVRVEGYDWAIVTSPFGARELLRRARGQLPPVAAAVGLETPAVSIGPETTRAARSAGIRVVTEAETHDLEGLVAAVAQAAQAAV